MQNTTSKAEIYMNYLIIILLFHLFGNAIFKINAYAATPDNVSIAKNLIRLTRDDIEFFSQNKFQFSTSVTQDIKKLQEIDSDFFKLYEDSLKNQRDLLKKISQNSEEDLKWIGDLEEKDKQLLSQIVQARDLHNSIVSNIMLNSSSEFISSFREFKYNKLRKYYNDYVTSQSDQLKLLEYGKSMGTVTQDQIDEFLKKDNSKAVSSQLENVKQNMHYSYQRTAASRISHSIPPISQISISELESTISSRIGNLGRASGDNKNYGLWLKEEYSSFSLPRTDKKNLDPQSKGFSLTIGADRSIDDSDALLGVAFSHSSHEIDYGKYVKINKELKDILNNNILSGYFSTPFLRNWAAEAMIGYGFSNIYLEGNKEANKGKILNVAASAKYQIFLSRFIINFIAPEINFVSYNYEKGQNLLFDQKGNFYSGAVGLDAEMDPNNGIIPRVALKIKYSKYNPDKTSLSKDLLEDFDFSGISGIIGVGIKVKKDSFNFDSSVDYTLGKNELRGIGVTLSARVEL
jgi:hypothetical protein